jgi:hypothetical protein
MILFDKSKTNTCLFTLTELAINQSLVEGPLYLFEFRNIQSNEIQRCIQVDNSFNKDRYNSFNITSLSDNPIFNKGQITVTNGTYEYTVFETNKLENQIDDYVTYDTLLNDGVLFYQVEIGLFKVFDSINVIEDNSYNNITNDLVYIG